MKISHLAAAAFSVAFIATAHADVSKKDHEFLTNAAAGGLYEVEAGKLAQGKASSDGVRSFGSMLVKDHGAANDELKDLARSKGVSLPTAIPADKQLRLDKIVIAKNFDREFVEEVGLEDHKTTLKAHRELAESLKKSLEK